MKKIFLAYKNLIGIIFEHAPIVVIMTFIIAIICGFLTPLSVFIDRHIFDDGLLVAKGAMMFSEYLPFLVILVVITVLKPILSELIIYGFIEPRALLILNTHYKGKMLKKLKTLKYEHMENSDDVEIIDKAFNRAVNSARHMFPMYVVNAIQSIIASIGILYMIASVKWWLLITVLLPFIFEVWWSTKHSYNIYDELEHYWNREHSYGILAGFLKSRDYLYEGKLNDSSDFLIDTYGKRLNSRNKEYEGFYFKHLKSYFVKGNISKISSIGNVILFLLLYISGEMSVGSLIALSLIMFSTLYDILQGATSIFKWSAYHMKFLEYYNKFFELSDDVELGNTSKLDSYDIEFKNVCFRYPGIERDILKNLCFYIPEGERISVVGENGEGKSTMIKLLLGLFEPTSGEILLGGKPINSYSRETRNKIFAPIFQDFTRYSMSLRENIAAGNIELLNDDAEVANAAKLAQISKDISLDTLLGRDFESGIDLSGGQWQRVAIARAFLGNKQILILDEPTSQLDPMAESKLYSEFANLTADKSAIFITHRLASTMITDRILVLSNGCIKEEGSHDELMKLNGIYAEMFEAQRKWYEHQDMEVELC